VAAEVATRQPDDPTDDPPTTHAVCAKMSASGAPGGLDIVLRPTHLTSVGACAGRRLLCAA